MTREELETRTNELSEIIKKFVKDTGTFSLKADGYEIRAHVCMEDFNKIPGSQDCEDRDGEYYKYELSKRCGDIEFFTLTNEKPIEMIDVANTLLRQVCYR